MTNQERIHRMLLREREQRNSEDCQTIGWVFLAMFIAAALVFAGQP